MRRRLLTSRDCIACRAMTPEAAVHRYHHRRQDKRRAGWRESKRRAFQRQAAHGWLHELACTGNHAGNRKCRPIAVFSRGRAA